jgi:Tc5 transposase-like protein/DDE superfamily endonuclease
MFRAENVIVTCSKSGKLTSSHVDYWRDEIVIPNMPKKSLLLSDSWKGQNDKKIYEKVPGLKRLQIPDKTTDRIQPLDVYFNRQMKAIIRRMYDRVALDQLDIQMSDRNSIIKLVSLVHSQMAAPLFHKLIQYAWHASGYVETHPGDFQNVVDACFSFNWSPCGEKKCSTPGFIQCSWCRKVLCFQHFYVDYHYH